MGELGGAGAMVAAHGLDTEATATTVRIRDGEALVTDGPFAETKESFFSYIIIDVADLDAALGWAKRMPNVDLRVGRGPTAVQPRAGRLSRWPDTRTAPPPTWPSSGRTARSGRTLLATLAGQVGGDVGLAEEAVADAFAAAAAEWPTQRRARPGPAAG